MRSFRYAVALVAGFPLTIASAQGLLPRTSSGALPPPAILDAPFGFEVNRGQTDPRVRLLARAGGYLMFFTDSEVVFAPRGARRAGSKPLRLRFLGSRTAQVLGESERPAKVNYIRGNDPSRWRTGIPTFERLRYASAYPGVDVVFYRRGNQVEYDFEVAPGADPSRIRMAFAGGGPLRLDARGDVAIEALAGGLRLSRPTVYQEVAGARRHVDGRFALDPAGDVTVVLGPYDPARTLVIDPRVSYSTYLGGTSNDYGQAIAVDGAGAVYVAGRTDSLDFPTENPYQVDQDSITSDVFVTKFRREGLLPTGFSLAYSTYIGGTGSEGAQALAVDSDGSAYVAGSTTSLDFPTFPHIIPTPPVGFRCEPACPLQPVHRSLGDPVVAPDGFVTKLDPSGSSLVYSTFLGGTSYDVVNAIAVDAIGNAHLAGVTGSSDFPTENAFQASFGGVQDAFVAKLNTTGSGLLFSSYLGGSGLDVGNGVAVRSRFELPDDMGRLIISTFVTGNVGSTNFPTTTDAAQNGNAGGAFVARFGTTGSLVYSTRLGGGGEAGTGIAVDDVGSAYVTGSTASTAFPTVNAVQAGHGGSSDAFLAKLNPAGNALAYSTYLGGAGNDMGRGVAVRDDGSAYIVGETGAPNFPSVRAFQPVHGIDAFVARFRPDGSLDFSTPLGGSQADSGHALALGGTSVFITGETYSPDFPRPIHGLLDAPWDPDLNTPASLGNFTDAFMARITDAAGEAADLVVTATASPDPVQPGSPLTYTTTIANLGPEEARSVALVQKLSPETTFVSASPSGCKEAGKTVYCALPAIPSGGSASTTVSVTVNRRAQ